MSKIVVMALGLLLIAAGAASIIQGYPIVVVERGWTQVIAGATALSAGVVTLAIGFLIGAVNRLRRALAPAAAAHPPEPVAIAAPDPFAPPPSKDPIEPLPPPRTAPLDAAPEAEIAGGRGSWIDEALSQDAGPRRDEPAPAAADAPSFDQGEAAPPEPEPVKTARKPPTLVGRYAFGGADYLLYDDGSIDATTPAGVVRFNSLAELRAHLHDPDQRPAG